MTGSEDVRGAGAVEQLRDPEPALQRLDGAGLAVAMRLARRGYATVAAVAALTVAEVADAAGVGDAQAARISAAARGGPAPEAPSAPDGSSAAAALIGTGAGFTVAPPREAEQLTDLPPGELERRLDLLSRRTGMGRRGPLASARVCADCGLIESYPRPNLRRPREPGEMPSHGAKFSYSLHLCERRGTVSVGKAPEKVRNLAAANRDNDAVFREYPPA